MRRSLGILVIVALSACWGAACRGSEESGEMPTLLKTRFQSEMKTILHDVKLAQEQASALEGTYLPLSELRARYFQRTVPESYVLTLGEVTASAFRAEVVHGASGLRCHLLVGGSVPEVPRCD